MRMVLGIAVVLVLFTLLGLALRWLTRVSTSRGGRDERTSGDYYAGISDTADRHP